MTTTTNTFANLAIGTIVTYNDSSNSDLQFVILDSITDKFGEWVNVMNLDTRCLECKSADTEIGIRWTV